MGHEPSGPNRISRWRSLGSGGNKQDITSELVSHIEMQGPVYYIICSRLVGEVGMKRRHGYGDLAHEMLDLIGRADTPMTPGQVRDAIDGSLAYTTVMTVMTRLHDQGLLTRQRSGRAFAYTALGDSAVVTARRMHRLLDIGPDRAGVLARFVDGLNTDDERLLRRILRQITIDQGRPMGAVRPPGSVCE